MITQTQLGQLADGLDQTLSEIESDLVSQVFAETLPILGNNLADAAVNGAAQLQYVSALKAAIVNGLRSLSGPGTYSEIQVESAINAALGNEGIVGLGANADFSNSADLDLSFATLKNFGALAVPVEADLGLANLGFLTSGNVQTTFNYQLDFDAGLDGTGFYLDTAWAGTAFKISTETKLAGFNAAAKLSDLPVVATDNGTDFDGVFTLTLKDPNSDGKLRTGELAGSPDLLDATLSGLSALNLKLISNLPDAAALPELGTTLSTRWSFIDATLDPTDTNAAFGEVPIIYFSNNTVNLGSFFNGFANRTLGEISRITGPLQPVIDVLTEPIPILSDLGSSKVTLLDLVGADPGSVAAIEGLNDIVGLTDLIASFSGNDNVLIQLGSLNVNGDLRTDVLGDISVSLAGGPVVRNQDADLDKFLADVNTLGGGGLSFPLLTRPTAIGELFLGKDVNLIDYAPAPLALDFEFSQYFPVLGVVGVKLGGHVGLAFQFDIGFDTQGVRDFVAGGSTDASKVFNGFYVRAFDDNSDPVTAFLLAAGVIAGVQANIGIANVGVDGDLTATVTFAFDSALDPDGDGKIRGDTLTSTPLGDLFDPSGELTTGLRAYLEVGISPFSIEFSFESPRVTLLDFDGDTSQPILASDGANGDLLLNVGPRSADRIVGNLTDRAETYFVSNDFDPLFPDVLLGLKIQAFKIEQFIDGFPARVVGDGGEHSDKLELAPDVNVPAVFTGGLNRDVLTGGAADDVLSGDDGPDVLSGNGGVDILRGGAGSDYLAGGAGGDVLDGGDGNDTASYATAAAGMLIDLRTNTFTNDGVGDSFISIERYEGTQFDDTINGDDTSNSLLSGLDGADTIRGFAGNDLLDGGKGNDTLEGGADADFLVGGPGADVIDGGDGIDSVAYMSSKTPVTVSLRTGLGTGGDAQGDTLINVEVLYGSPLPFGDLSTRIHPLTGKPITSGTGDTLEGGDGPDVISGFGGADFIDGGAGDDVLYGDAAGTTDVYVSPAGPVAQSALGFDDDTLRGGLGNDRLFGQQDDDDLDGGDGQDILDGGDGDDYLRTLDLGSVDTLDGGTGVNRLSADYSDKLVPITWIAGQNNDYTFADGDLEKNFQNVGELDTGNLNDVIRLDGAADDGFDNIIRTNGGDDIVYTGFGFDHLEGGDGNDILYGGAADTRDGNDFIDGGAGDDYVNGGDTRVAFISDYYGTITGHAGGNADVLAGGPGNDTISFDQLRKTVFMDPDETGFGKGLPLGVSINLATNSTGIAAEGIVISGFENIIGTDFGDELTGDEGPNIFQPLRGGGAFNGVTGGPDRIDGAGGEDTLRIDFSLADLPELQGVVTNSGILSRVYIGNQYLGDSYYYQNIEHLQITGASKNDILYPWVGNGANSDILIGLGGNDALGGGGGADTLLGGDGNDVLTAQGYAGLTALSSGYYGGVAGGNDVLDGGAGDDLVEDIGFQNGLPSLGADALFQLDGGTGFDTLWADFSNQTAAIVWDSTAPANIDFADGAYFHNFEELRDFATGTGNDAIVQQGRVNNRFHLGAGNDTVNPGLGVDTVYGGEGFDVAILDFSVGDTAEMAGVKGDGGQDGGLYIRNFASGLFNAPDIIFLRGFERVQITGTSKNDTLAGTYGDDTILGGDGNDILSGFGGGNDFLDGGNGDDVLNGSSGYNGTGANDTMYGGAGNDTFTPGKGSDTIFGGIGNDIITATDYPSDGYGMDVFDAGDGDDVVADVYFNGPYTYTNAATRLSLEGGAGFDKLSADFGNQTQAIVFIDGAVNTVEFADGSYFRNFETLGSFISGSGNDTFMLVDRVDNGLAGGAGNDIVNPGLGIDSVYGGAGDDLLILDYSLGDAANVSGVAFTGASLQRHDLNTNAIIDSVRSTDFERYQITGGGKDDFLLGASSTDMLIGNAGNDTLNGYAGADTLTGGAGADHFAGGAGDLNLDQITDFGLEDIIDVSYQRFSALRYNTTTGVLELDTSANGSFATRVNLSAGLVGEFVATPSVIGQPPSTQVRLMQDSDGDGDGVGDFHDNAILAFNPDQRDTDGDGYGNVADADLNQDMMVDFFDLSLLDGVFGSNDANADFNGDGTVDFYDLDILASLFGAPPGPSYVDSLAIASAGQAEALAEQSFIAQAQSLESQPQLDMVL
jgi:Ca2+-binding RTX toxin-like protein